MYLLPADILVEFFGHLPEIDKGSLSTTNHSFSQAFIIYKAINRWSFNNLQGKYYEDIPLGDVERSMLLSLFSGEEKSVGPDIYTCELVTVIYTRELVRTTKCCVELEYFLAREDNTVSPFGDELQGIKISYRKNDIKGEKLYSSVTVSNNNITQYIGCDDQLLTQEMVDDEVTSVWYKAVKSLDVSDFIGRTLVIYPFSDLPRNT